MSKGSWLMPDSQEYSNNSLVVAAASHAVLMLSKLREARLCVPDDACGTLSIIE